MSKPATSSSSSNRNDEYKRRAEEALKLARDPNASLFELVFAVPTRQKIAVFPEQRKRFAEREHAELYANLHAEHQPLGTHLAIFKGTLEEITSLPMVMPKEELLDLEDDYGGKEPEDCEWEVVGYNISEKEFFELRDDEEFVFATREAALECARFICNYCLMTDRSDANQRVAVTDRARNGQRKNCFLIKRTQ